MRLAVGHQHNVATALPAVKVVGLGRQQDGQENRHPLLRLLRGVRALSAAAHCAPTTAASAAHRLHSGDQYTRRMLAGDMDHADHHPESRKIGARGSRWPHPGQRRDVQRADDREVRPGALSVYPMQVACLPACLPHPQEPPSSSLLQSV
eukprot:SAG25_NODE_736_length_5645_cov_2.188965_6_plen_150_part_00